MMKVASSFLTLLLLVSGSSAFASKDQCDDAFEETQQCCEGSGCLKTESDNDRQAQIDANEPSPLLGSMGIRQQAENMKRTAQVDQWRKDLATKRSQNCTNALTKCTKYCEGYDAEKADNCEKSKANASAFLKPASKPPVMNQNESDAVQKVLDETTSMPQSTMNAPSSPGSGPTKEPSGDPYNSPTAQ